LTFNSNVSGIHKALQLRRTKFYPLWWLFLLFLQMLWLYTVTLMLCSENTKANQIETNTFLGLLRWLEEFLRDIFLKALIPKSCERKKIYRFIHEILFFRLFMNGIGFILERKVSFICLLISPLNCLSYEIRAHHHSVSMNRCKTTAIIHLHAFVVHNWIELNHINNFFQFLKTTLIIVSKKKTLW
jgi:hypothetical protein